MTTSLTDLAILRWLVALDSREDIATTAKIMAALNMTKAVAWPACERLEKAGHVVYCYGRGDRPGGWSATYAGRQAAAS